MYIHLSLVYTFLVCYCIYIMAKKYLLYIHDEAQFDKVENKSQLINTLLAAYWSPPKKLEPVDRGPKKIVLDKFKASKVCKKGHFYTGSRCMQKGCD